MLAPSTALPGAQAASLFGLTLRALALHVCLVLCWSSCCVSSATSYACQPLRRLYGSMRSRLQMPYLMHVPMGVHPFSRGLLQICPWFSERMCTESCPCTIDALMGALAICAARGTHAMHECNDSAHALIWFDFLQQTMCLKWPHQ